VQECKEPKVEMYKPIWGLVFKCNGSGIQFNTIQFSQEYSNQRNVRKKKKRSNNNTKCNRVRLKNAYVSGTLNLQQLRLSRNNKNRFTLVELGPLHKKSEWQHTQKGEHYSSKMVEHYNSRKRLQEDHEGSSWENREKLDWA
jgi:hypothetical protein